MGIIIIQGTDYQFETLSLPDPTMGSAAPVTLAALSFGPFQEPEII